MSETPLDAAKLTKIYRKIREAKEAASSAFKKQEAELQAQLDTVSQMLLKIIDEEGGTGLKNEFGTVTKIIKTRYWSTDWDSFKEFCKENDALDLFEQRVAQKNMEQFLKDNPTKIPVGLQTDRKYVVRVVKPYNKPE